jgi:hypothetical protein
MTAQEVARREQAEAEEARLHADRQETLATKALEHAKQGEAMLTRRREAVVGESYVGGDFRHTVRDMLC